MKHLFIASICCLLASQCCFAWQTLPESHYKYKAVAAVCEKIAATKGDVRKKPQIEVYSRTSPKQVIAQFTLQPVPTIFVDEKLYDICASFGKDSLHALACIVGHELAHYYENHTWMNSFAELTAGNTSKMPDKVSKAEKSRFEAAADYFGLFYGFLAGYETYLLLPQVLKAIYSTYHLPEQIPGYPSREERIHISQEKVKEFLPLMHTFKAGQILYIKKKYEEAALCYEYIASKFPGKEIYNNSGIVKLAQAAEMIGKDELYFAYPFELDAKTRLGKSSVRTGVEDISKIHALLKESKAQLEKAIALDELYTPAYINLACVYSMQNNQEAAIGKINELEQLCNENRLPLPANAYLVKGIAQVKNGQIDKAYDSFENAARNKAYMADYNVALYKKIQADWQTAFSDWLTQWPKVEKWINKYWKGEPEKPSKVVEESHLTQLLSNTKVNTNEAIMISDRQHPVKISAANVDLQEGYGVVHIQTEEYKLEMLSCTPNYTEKTSTGIAARSNLNDILQTYGQPSYTVAGANSTVFYGYDLSRIIFEVQNEVVKGWSVYKIVY